RGVLAAPRIGRDVSELEELPAGVRPAQRSCDRPLGTRGIVQLVVAAIGIGLQDAAEAAEMSRRMLAAPITRGVIERRRGSVPAERPVIADIGPDVTLDGLAL